MENKMTPTQKQILKQISELNSRHACFLLAIFLFEKLLRVIDLQFFFVFLWLMVLFYEIILI